MATNRRHNPHASTHDEDICNGCPQFTKDDVLTLIEDLQHHTIRSIEFTVFKLSFNDSFFRHTGIRLHVYRTDGSEQHFVHEVTGGSGSVKYNPSSSAPKSVVVLRSIQSGNREMKPSEEFKFATLKYAGLHPSLLREFKNLFEYDFEYNLVFNNCRDQVTDFAEKLRSIGVNVEEKVFDFIKGVKTEDGGLILGGAALFAAGLFGLGYLAANWAGGSSKKAKEVEYDSDE